MTLRITVARARVPPIPLPPYPPQLTLSAPRDRKLGTRLPDDFTPSPEMVEWFRKNCPHVDGKTEHAQFCDYWRAKPGKDGRKLDWLATWRNWMRTAEERYKPRPRGSAVRARVHHRRPRAAGTRVRPPGPGIHRPERGDLMNAEQAGQVLAKCASYDRRKTGDADTIAWYQVLGDLAYDDCIAAVIAHYSETTDWIMPAHIRRRVREIRNQRIQDAEIPAAAARNCSMTRPPTARPSAPRPSPSRTAATRRPPCRPSPPAAAAANWRHDDRERRPADTAPTCAPLRRGRRLRGIRAADPVADVRARRARLGDPVRRRRAPKPRPS